MADRANVNVSTPALSRLYTLEQVADRLQVSVRTLRRWIDAGDLVAHRIGRGLRITEADLQTFIRIRRNG